MAENSKIEWCDHTFNPWIGCTKVSPGCANCYAAVSTRARVLRSCGKETWGKGATRERTSAANWKLPLRWNKAAGDPDRAGAHYAAHGVWPSSHRPRVFCASLADWLDDEVPAAWLLDLLSLVEATPHLDWLLLSKRPENWGLCLNVALGTALLEHRSKTGKIVDFISGWLAGTPPANVWIGTTAEDQTRADARIPELLKIPALVRFLSCEPLLGPLDLTDVGCDGSVLNPECWGQCACDTLYGYDPGCRRNGGDGQLNRRIHWVIAGGESGKDARPMHPDWARSLRDQCKEAVVPFLFKQWGEWGPDPSDDTKKLYHPHQLVYRYEDGTLAPIGKGHPAVKEFLYRNGKKITGRLLDGIEHNGFPVVKKEVARA